MASPPPHANRGAPSQTVRIAAFGFVGFVCIARQMLTVAEDGAVLSQQPDPTAVQMLGLAASSPVKRGSAAAHSTAATHSISLEGPAAPAPSLRAQRAAMHAEASAEFIVIISRQRSSSTVLSQAISAHPCAAWANEMFHNQASRMLRRECGTQDRFSRRLLREHGKAALHAARFKHPVAFLRAVRELQLTVQWPKCGCTRASYALVFKLFDVHLTGRPMRLQESIPPSNSRGGARARGSRLRVLAHMGKAFGRLVRVGPGRTLAWRCAHPPG